MLTVIIITTSHRTNLTTLLWVPSEEDGACAPKSAAECVPGRHGHILGLRSELALVEFRDIHRLL